MPTKIFTKIGGAAPPHLPRSHALLLPLLAALLLSGCGATLPTPQPLQLTLVTTESQLPLAQDLVAAYQAEAPHVTIQIQTVANSLAASQQIAPGRSDLALTAQPLQPAGQIQPLSSQQIGWDALALVVHPTNPIDNLSQEAARQLLSGDIRDWADLQGNPGPIQIASRESGSAARTALDRFSGPKHPLTPTALILPGSRLMHDHIAANPQAIGYLSAAALDDRVKPLRLDNLPPDPATAQNSGYPLLVPLHLITTDPPDPAAAAFIDFAQDNTQKFCKRQRPVVK